MRNAADFSTLNIESGTHKMMRAAGGHSQMKFADAGSKERPRSYMTNEMEAYVDEGDRNVSKLQKKIG